MGSGGADNPNAGFPVLTRAVIRGIVVSMHDDFPILAAIAASPAHSFSILEHLQAIGVPVARSTLYRRVDALVRDGLVRAEEIRGVSGHVQRELHLTGAAGAIVAADIREVLASAPLESPIFALAVGCARLTDTDALPEVLKPRMAAAARTLTNEERTLRTRDAEEWDRIARERRVAHLQADIAWLQSVMGRRLVSGKRAAERVSRDAA